MGWLVLLLYITGAVYLAFMFFCLAGWRKLKAFAPAENASPQVKFSIIIPARNEAENIEKCLQSIAQQNYNKAHFEVLLMDDFSEDATVEIAKNFAQQNPQLNLHICTLEKMLLQQGVAHKKRAIEEGISCSKNNWIFTTDADCVLKPNYLQILAAFIEEKDPVLVSGPVALVPRNNFFEKAQALEFSGLIGIGAASIAQQKPNMCNGANLCYNKEAFFAVGGYAGLNHIASGDDELLMHRLHKKFPGKIMFLKSAEALVETAAISDLNQFINQRKRWVSKSRKYENKGLTLMLLPVYIFYFLLIFGLVASIFQPTYIWAVLLAWALKVVAEGVFLRRVNSFFGTQNLMKYYLPSLPLQVLYVVFIGIYGNFGKYTWKGRKVQ